MTAARIAFAVVVVVLAHGRAAHSQPRMTSILGAAGHIADYGQREEICEDPLTMLLPPARSGITRCAAKS